MKRSALSVGDRVWIVLPYEGGRGWAEILHLGDKHALVRFEADYRHIYQWDWKSVLYRHIRESEPVS